MLKEKCSKCRREYDCKDLDADVPVDKNGDPVRIKGDYPLKCRSCHPNFAPM